VSTEEPLLTDEDLLDLGELAPDAFGHLALLWRFDRPTRGLERWSLARLKSLDFAGGCVAFGEEPLPLGLYALPSSLAAPAGSHNDDDDLDDLVGEWGDGEELQEEREVTDERVEKDEDERADPDSGHGA
jgi:hypothetical protein